MTKYRHFSEQLGKRDSRKIGNNTYLVRRDEKTIAIMYHATDVVTMTPHYIELNSGGWYTPTTKDRMEYCGLRIASTRNGWMVFPAKSDIPDWHSGGYVYYDGIRFSADATRILKSQPNLPRGIQRPIFTRSGFTGMTRHESTASRERMYAAMLGGDAETFVRERATLAGKTLIPDKIEETSLGTAVTYTMDREMIGKCPHVIFSPEHYRANGHCRCDDPTHTEMIEWGYTWNGGQWV